MNTIRKLTQNRLNDQEMTTTFTDKQGKRDLGVFVTIFDINTTDLVTELLKSGHSLTLGRRRTSRKDADDDVGNYKGGWSHFSEVSLQYVSTC